MSDRRRQTGLDGSEDDESESNREPIQSDPEASEAGPRRREQPFGSLLKINSLRRHGAFVTTDDVNENPYDPAVVRRNAQDLVAHIREDPGVPEPAAPVFKEANVKFTNIPWLGDETREEDIFGDNEYAADTLFLYHKVEQEEIRFDMNFDDGERASSSKKKPGGTTQKRTWDADASSSSSNTRKRPKGQETGPSEEDFSIWGDMIRPLAKDVLVDADLNKIERAMSKLEIHADDLTIDKAKASGIARIVKKISVKANDRNASQDIKSLRKRADELNTRWHINFNVQQMQEN